MIKKRLVCLAAALLAALSGCGPAVAEEESPLPTLTPPAVTESPSPSPTPTPTETPEATPTPTPTPEVYEGPRSPLTGLPMEEEEAARRPVAVMLNNLKAALPQQGNSQADIIYEVLAEGGITRMLAVYQDVSQVGELGSIRSARPYYIELALGHDAVYIHAGGSPDAYNKLSSWDVDHMDGVRGNYSYSGLFWRDRSRIEGKYFGYEHSLLTSGEDIETALASSGFRLDRGEGRGSWFPFREDGTPEGGEPAQTVTVPFSTYKTGVFRYDSATGLYLVEEYGEPYVDGNDGSQVAVTNVLVLKTSCRVIPGDSAGRLTVDLSGGEGWYACGGQIIPIRWSKGDRNAPLTCTHTDGTPLELGYGRTYVNIIPLDQTVRAE